MQVEVSKYTEGINEKALRPNGLPKSLIRYDGNCSSKFLWHMMLPSPLIFTFDVLARQKEKAMGSITEVVQTVKNPRSHYRAMSHDTTRKKEDLEKFNLDYVLPKSILAANATPVRQTPQQDLRDDGLGKKPRLSSRVSFTG